MNDYPYFRVIFGFLTIGTIVGTIIGSIITPLWIAILALEFTDFFLISVLALIFGGFFSGYEKINIAIIGSISGTISSVITGYFVLPKSLNLES